MGNKIYTAIGLMSGTSLDGVDVAHIKTDGQGMVESLGFKTYPYEETLKDFVRACFGKKERDAETDAADALITDAHIKAVKAFGQKADLIGFHGQTITHDPDAHFTWQLGDGQRLAKETGMDVVFDFRSADVKAGGQGAPLIPLYHQAKAQKLPKPLAVLNLGGVGNVTWLGRGPDDILAFDTGPGGALIDDFVKKRTGKSFDADGVLARAGWQNETMLMKWLSHPYFRVRPPKSLDRNAFDVSAVETLTDADGAATLTHFTVRGIKEATGHFPEPARRWLVAGGGRHNRAIMEGLSILEVPARPVEAVGWNGDALEAEGFAYLAVRSVLGLPLSLPATTGVKQPLSGGTLFKA